MTGEEMERAIAFLLNSQAQLTGDIQSLTGDVHGLKEAVQGLTDVQTKTSRDVAALASSVGELTGVVVNLTEVVARLETQMDRMEAQAESDRQETREAINNLIIANEVTRDLTKQVASLEVQTSQRVTKMDERLKDMESKLP